jgi:hypothetical protein
MSAEKKPKGPQIPERVINELGEYADRGFTLFYFDNETGEPQQVSVFGDRVHAIAMEKYIEMYSQALKDLQIGDIQESIVGENCAVVPEDGEEEEEE